MQTIDLSLNRKPTSYHILIGDGTLTQPINVLSNKPYQHIAIISNEMVSSLYRTKVLKSLLSSGYKGEVSTILIGDGESYKSFESFTTIMDELINKKFRRSDLIIALGGGVVGDISGFSAACYQRGMDFIQIPTSLLAMVDSSVGGKTAINHPQGKNMVGAFHQPVQVRIDTDCLKTLASNQFNAGIAEIIKIAAIYDSELFDWLELNLESIKALEPKTLEEMIYQSCKLKALVVEQDELESGIRAVLNFGHTFGHAIESLLGYGKILHGEAVAIGMVLAAKLSEEKGLLETTITSRLSSLLQTFELPITLPKGLSARDIVEYMSIDKKNINENIRLILLKELGKASVQEVEADELINFLKRYE